MRLGVPACAVDSADQGSGSLHWHTELKAAPWDAPPPAAFTGKSAPPCLPGNSRRLRSPHPHPRSCLRILLPRISLAPGQG